MTGSNIHEETIESKAGNSQLFDNEEFLISYERDASGNPSFTATEPLWERQLFKDKTCQTVKQETFTVVSSQRSVVKMYIPLVRQPCDCRGYSYS